MFMLVYIRIDIQTFRFFFWTAWFSGICLESLVLAFLPCLGGCKKALSVEIIDTSIVKLIFDGK